MLSAKSKILIVDDDRAIVNFICDVLIEENYEVLSAFNGKSALEITQAELPDLIILDWEMPIMDGIETLSFLKAIDSIKDIPVIMITGRLNSKKDLKYAFDAGAIDFIRKPIDSIELIARTKSMLLLNKYFKDSVRKKDWELTLLSNSHHQNTKLLSDLTSFIGDVKDYNKNDQTKFIEELKEKVKRIKLNISNSSWEQFQSYFVSVHPNFQENLLAQFPNITNEELRLCYFLRLNMSSKEIASITNKEMHSIDIARYRLRKKLNLERNEKLNVFLSGF